MDLKRFSINELIVYDKDLCKVMDVFDNGYSVFNYRLGKIIFCYHYEIRVFSFED